MHQDQFGEFKRLSREFLAAVTVGDPRKSDTVVGPLIRPEHRDRVAGFIDRAIAAGGEVIHGGQKLDINGGWYYAPTLVCGLPQDAELVQEEVFGPVAVASPYVDLDDAVAQANGTIHGLSSYIFGDRDQALKLAPRLRAGGVMINGGGYMPVDAPFGGFKQSGIGRELGEWGFREFLEPQHIQVAVS